MVKRCISCINVSSLLSNAVCNRYDLIVRAQPVKLRDVRRKDVVFTTLARRLSVRRALNGTCHSLVCLRKRRRLIEQFA